jgi:hypothetical protein
VTTDGKPAFRERTVEFGPESRLRGIVTVPAGASTPWTAPAVVILNAGVIHRVGPNRLSVRIARGVAELGIPALRFDLSGLGDSLPRKDARPLDESVALDVDAAFAFLAETYGAKQFVTLGLCSGGREAFRAAYRDPRVAGAVMIDPWGYRTAGFYLRHYGRRLLRLESWRGALGGRNRYLDAIRMRLNRQPQPPPPAVSVPDMAICGLPEFPPTVRLREAVGEVLERGTHLMFVYTSGMPAYYNYESQLRDMIPGQFGHPGLRYAYIAKSDHTFSSEDHRRALLSHMQQWLTETGVAPVRATGHAPMQPERAQPDPSPEGLRITRVER